MSTDDVKFNSKKMEKMNKLPKGEFYNVRFDIDESGFNQDCYNQCIASPDAAYILGGNTAILDSCTKLSSGKSSCLSLIQDNYSADQFQAIMNSTSIDFNTFCSNINAITPNSVPSEFDNQIENCCIM